MGILDRLREGLGAQRPTASVPGETSAEDQAIARYRYMLRTAPPETIEQAHAEAFAKLTPEQRRRVLGKLSTEIPEAERTAVLGAGFGPEQLARTATRAEIRQPGVMERTLGGLGAGPGSGVLGVGSLFAGSFLSSVAGAVLGSMIAQQFFTSHPDVPGTAGETAGTTNDTTAQPVAEDRDDLASSNIADAEDMDFGDDIGGDSGSWDV